MHSFLVFPSSLVSQQALLFVNKIRPGKLTSDLPWEEGGERNYRWALQSDKFVPWATEENKEGLHGRQLEWLHIASM